MSVNAMVANYKGNRRDKLENFNGSQVVYVGWEYHLLFSYPFALLAPADTTFREFIENNMEGAFAAHPEWKQIDWQRVNWTQGGKAITPDMDKTLAENGIHHKASLRFSTPDLKGVYGESI